MSPNQQRILLLVILNTIVKRFIAGEPPLSASHIAERMQLPVRLSREIIYQLTEAGILTEINIEAPKERVYQPGIDPSRLNLHYILSRLDHIGTGDVPVLKNSEYKRIDKLMQSVSERIKGSDSNMLISEL